MDKNLILIQCTDKVGLVALIARILASHNLNITAMREFVDEKSSTFFTRIECSGNLPSKPELYLELERELPLNSQLIINPKPRKKIAILVTKEYHCLAETLTRHFFNTLGAEVSCVIGNHNNLEAFTKQFRFRFSIFLMIISRSLNLKSRSLIFWHHFNLIFWFFQSLCESYHQISLDIIRTK